METEEVRVWISVEIWFGLLPDWRRK